jgi:hypothetical protein
MKKITLLLIPALLLFLSSCLDEQELDPVQNALAEIEATFTDADTGAPLSDYEFFMIIEIEEFSQPVDIGLLATDASGFAAIPIEGPSEDTITKIIFEYEVGPEIRTIEEEVNLQLRFEEPINSVSLEFEVDVSEN